MPKCMSCGAPTTAPGICTDCVTAKWYTAVIYYAVVVFLFFFILSLIILTAKNIATFKTFSEFGAGQYFRNIAHIHDKSWIGEVKDNGTLYAFDEHINPTDSMIVTAGTRFENWGYRKENDSTMLVAMKIYRSLEETENWFLRVPEKWSWFSMIWSPKSNYIHHDVVRRLEKKQIEAYYDDPRIAEFVVQAKGKKEIKKYKADKSYKKMKAERSFNILQKFLVPIVEAVFMPGERRADFILKEDAKKLKQIKKEYFNDDRFIEEYLVMSD